MATCTNHTNGKLTELSYESEANIIEISKRDELSVRLYTQVPENQGNVDVGGQTDLANHVTEVTVPDDERLRLAQYFRESAEMLEGKPKIYVLIITEYFRKPIEPNVPILCVEMFKKRSAAEKCAHQWFFERHQAGGQPKYITKDSTIYELQQAFYCNDIYYDWQIFERTI